MVAAAITDTIGDLTSLWTIETLSDEELAIVILHSNIPVVTKEMYARHAHLPVN